MGRPCCSVHNCTIALRSTQDRFCPSHASLDSICAVTDCDAPVAKGYRTCSLVAHRAVEDRFKLMGKAAFHLRSRLQRSKVTTPEDSVAPKSPEDEDDIELDEDDEDAPPPPDSMPSPDSTPPDSAAALPPVSVMPDSAPPPNSTPSPDSAPPPDSTPSPDSTAPPNSAPPLAEPPSLPSPPPCAQPPPPSQQCPDKPPEGNRKLRAMFGRRRTHNEQLFVRPCGMIIERDTCFGSESVSQIAVCGSP